MLKLEYRPALVLTSSLIQHYNEQETLYKKDVTEYLKQTTSRDETIQTWKQISKQAEEEARKLAENLKESRENKLFRKRKQTESTSDLKPGQKQKHYQHYYQHQYQDQQRHQPNPLIQALTGLIHDLSKTNIQKTSTYKGKGKEPAHGRGFFKKGGPPSQGQ